MSTPPTSDQLAGNWTLDTGASSVRFAHKTMWGLVNVKGTLTGLSGTGTVAPDGSVQAVVTLPSSSIASGNKKRDEHLRSADFLDADTYPLIAIAVSSVRPGDGALHASATLTVKGVDRPVDIVASITDTDATTMTLDIETVVDRADFGITWNQIGMMRGVATVTVTAVLRRT